MEESCNGPTGCTTSYRFIGESLNALLCNYLIAVLVFREFPPQHPFSWSNEPCIYVYLTCNLKWWVHSTTRSTTSFSSLGLSTDLELVREVCEGVWIQYSLKLLFILKKL